MKQQRRVYVVGGAVRNVLMGKPVNDIDYVVVGATVEEMLAEGYQQVGADFPVFLKNGCEYALARTERKNGKGYHGFDVDANNEVTLDDDLMRRDLTINAMAVQADYWDSFVEQAAAGGWSVDTMLHDPHGGYSDLINGLIRPVKLETFIEDPLRVLRAARFAAVYNMVWTRDMELAAAHVVASDELHSVSAERYAAEIAKVLEQCETAGQVTQFSLYLNRFELFPTVLQPEQPVAKLLSYANITNPAKSQAAKLLALMPPGMAQVYMKRFKLPYDMVAQEHFAAALVRAANTIDAQRKQIPFASQEYAVLALYETVTKGKASLTLQFALDLAEDMPIVKVVTDLFPTIDQIYKDVTFETVIGDKKDTIPPSQYGTLIQDARLERISDLLK